ncbi:hypothetical protein QEV83_18130 [Methylocapsa sp. D3K7]|uniref:hypothetical protein n=1 Tax=Methylocapsa sp. D3K7 TaxID=3041435 RepID=UPI00244E87FF|nr:hypothetical protein [Methylocapsa sp. D3K7]WGJ14518.1 hypothetical protein QEV83_18130 [Methylocapsa sp. D3K7]
MDDSNNSNSDHSGAVSRLEEQVRALLDEKEQLVADLAQAKSSVETFERKLADALSESQEFTKEKDRLVAEMRNELQDLNGEGIFGFIRRRYFGQK